jgi:hypothetical protein
MLRKELQPASSHLAVGPTGSDIRAGTEDSVIMIPHNGVGADLYSEDGSEMLQAVDKPCLTVGEVPACERIESTQESPADAPAEAVIYTFLSFLDIFAARQCHNSPLSI